MWENRCKIAVSGVGFSKITRSAEVPLAAHALQAVKAAVEDSGLAMADIDGLATYAELPATTGTHCGRHKHCVGQLHDGDVEAAELSWHVQVETVNIGGAMQQAVNALLGGVCTYAVVWRAMHNPAAPTRTCPAPTPRERRSLPPRMASAALDRVWRWRTRAGWNGTTRSGRRWPPSP